MRLIVARCVTLMAVAAVVLLSARPVGAAGIYPRSDFDGIASLSYATVDARSERVPIYEQNPTSCTTPASCKVAGYVVTGDPVAIDAAPGNWSHVQYIGKTSVLQGWAETTHLRPLAAKVPADEGPPGRQDPRWYPQKWQIRVALLKGKGVPVCEAYLQRLNQTWFYEPPYCGRPENDQVPGFTRLHAAPLSSSEVNKLIVTEANFTSPGLGFTANPGALALAESATSAPVYLDTQGVLAAVRPGENISVWRYVPAVDIDNDGSPDNVIFWRGGSRPVWERCGQSLAGDRVNYEGPLALFLTADNGGVDVANTLAQFASLASPVAYSEQHYSIGVFQYRGEYYIDAFVGDEQAPKDSRQLLHVFHRKNRRLEQSCELVNSELDDWRSE